jgi:hypothetical protein
VRPADRAAPSHVGDLVPRDGHAVGGEVVDDRAATAVAARPQSGHLGGQCVVVGVEQVAEQVQADPPAAR